jgi:hypothetical protein
LVSCVISSLRKSVVPRASELEDDDVVLVVVAALVVEVMAVMGTLR